MDRTHTNEVARRAFDAVAAAQGATSLPDLEAAVSGAFKALGFHVHVGVRAIDAAGRPEVSILFGHPPETWNARYVDQGYRSHDLNLKHLRRSTEPAFWSELTQRHRPEGVARRIFDEATDFGLGEGFITPMHNLDGSISAVVLMADRVDARDPDLRAGAHLLSLYYGAVGLRLTAPARQASPPGRPLTARQRECLMWVRMGKSSADIGDLLGLSMETVNEHISGACQRLGVRTRVQAVAEAAARGLIAL